MLLCYDISPGLGTVPGYSSLKPHYARIGIFCYRAPPKVAECSSLLTTVINTNCASRPPNGQCTRVFVDKQKDMEPTKTTPEDKEAC